MDKHKLSYFLIRFITLPFLFMPFWIIQKLGKFFGYLCFFVMKEYRKRTLSNLSLANDLKLTNLEIRKTAIKSFQNLAITILEYPKLYYKKDLSKNIICENPQVAEMIYNEKKGIIFFCGHQSNWEVLFIDGTSRMQGIAIGRPIKNKPLYKWILKIRQKKGGRIITPKNALKEGLRSLKKGIFLGIVGDQGMPDSSYFFPFFGRRAWTSTAPALLSYKTNSPIIVATTRRSKNGYKIHYSTPIWPDLAKPLENEIIRLMDSSLTYLQKSIEKKPDEWLWQHNRFKQQSPKFLAKEFRFDSMAIVLPKEKDNFEKIYNHISTLREIYKRDFLFVICPEEFKEHDLKDFDEVIYYKNYKDALIKDFRFKLIFNFTSYKELDNFYLKLAAFSVYNIEKIKKIASKKHYYTETDDLSKIFKMAILKNNK